VIGFEGVNDPSQQIRIRFGRVKVRHFSPLSLARRSLRSVPLPTPSFVRSSPLRVRIELRTRQRPGPRRNSSFSAFAL
jgi:hypothetical protein